jgi:hypothetical protein
MSKPVGLAGNGLARWINPAGAWPNGLKHQMKCGNRVTEQPQIAASEMVDATLGPFLQLEQSLYRGCSRVKQARLRYGYLNQSQPYG